MLKVQARRSERVYLAGGGRVIVVPDDVTTVGLGVASPNVIPLEQPSALAIGAAVLRALDAAGRVIAHPDSQEAFRAETRRFLKSVGFRSQRQLVRECAVVHVRAEGADVIVTPTERHAAHGGYYSDRPDDAVRISATADAIGLALSALAEASSRQPTT